MPNYCGYQARIVGRKKESVERFLAILKYKDHGMDGSDGLYLARTFDATCDGGVREADGLFVADVFGNVAWSIHSCWFAGDSTYFSDADNKYPDGNPRNETYESISGETCYANLITTVPDICRMLGCAVEIWSEEPGFEFQEHYIVSTSGAVIENECVSWSEGRIDDDGNLVEGTESGGFDDWGHMMSPDWLFVR